MKPIKQENRERILHGNLLQAILLLSMPIVLNNFIQTMYNLTDTYWLGRIGTDPMAAITLVTPVQNVILNLGAGITVAGSVLISQYVGAKDMKQAKEMVNHLFLCSMAFALFFAAICFLCAPYIVNWLGADEIVEALAIRYLRIIILDMPFLFMINLYTSVNQSQGNTMKPMLLNLLGIGLNLILDPLFMIVFKWGITGAALATLFAKIPCAIIALSSLLNANHELSIGYKGFRFDKTKLEAILKVGLPSAIGGSTMQIGFLLMSKNVAEYGKVALAAYGIGNKVNGLISMPSNALGSAVAIVVGQNIGAKQQKRANQGYLLTMLISTLFLLIAGLILSRPPVSTALVSIFSSDQKVITLAAEFLSILALWCFSNGIYNTTHGLFMGSGHTMANMLVDASRLWGFRFLTLFICESVFHLGVQSIWLSVVISNGASSLVYIALYFSGIWKKTVVKIKKSV